MKPVQQEVVWNAVVQIVTVVIVTVDPLTSSPRERLILFYMKTEIIWKLYHGDVFRFVQSYVKDKDLANDLLQEVFIKIHLKKEGLEDEKFLKNWVLSIARNTVADHFRKITPSVNLEIVPGDQEHAQEHSPEDCLQPLIKQLPKKYREAVMLSDIQGKKQAVVAKELNLSLSGAKSRIQRGRKLIQQGYIDCCNYELKNGVLVGETKPQKGCKVCD